MNRILALMFLLFITILPFSGATAGGRPSSRLSVTTVSHGIALTLTVGRHSYPRSALAPVTLRAQNISGHLIRLLRFSYCTNPSLSAEVHDRRGQTVYPPPASTWLALPCPLSLQTVTLPIGHALVRHDFVILRANRIVPVVGLVASGSPQPSANTIGITGSPLTVALTSGSPPRVTLHTSVPVEATIQPPAGGKLGSLYYVDSGECPQGNRFLAWSGAIWQAVAPSASGQYVVHPRCGKPTNWSLAVGWPNHSVATAHYSTPRER